MGEFHDDQADVAFGYLPTVAARSHAVYVAVLLGMVALLAALPVIRVTVSAQAPGTLRPLAEKTEIRPLVAGTLTQLRASEIQTLQKGDTVFEVV